MECGTALTTAILLVVYDEMHHSDILVHINKNAGLQFCLAKSIHGDQYISFVLD
jgi:hypothetical protein